MLARPALAVLTAGAMLALASSSSSQVTWHVDASAKPGGDGRTWAAALDTLQDALDVATTDDQIWVAAGTYHPTERSDPADPRSARFLLTGAFKLFGGFAGTETSRGQRDPALFADTILSGDLGVRGVRSDNARHVLEVETFADFGLARLDGFRITGGNTSGHGGGIRVRATSAGYTPRLRLEHCILNDNSAGKGGAIAVERLGAVHLLRCVLDKNTASNQGGAIYSEAGGVLAVDTYFSENKALRQGGALFAEASNDGWIRHANCVFVANRAIAGGAAYLSGDTLHSGIASWFNCTFVENEAQIGGALFALTSTPTPALAYLYNSILWDNRAPTGSSIFGSGLDVRFSDVEGGYPGPGNLDVDPEFTEPGRPRAGSPVNDAGHNGLLVNDYLDLDDDEDKDEELGFDLVDGARRVDDPLAPAAGVGSGPIVDLGALEAGLEHGTTWALGSLGRR